MFATFNHVKTQYQVIGSGQPLVLLHGWGCDWQIWHPLITPLSAHFKLIIPDLPAFGQSSSPTETWQVSEYVLWLQEFIAHTTQNQNYHLMGHSFGGKMAAVHAASHPEKLQKLILIGSSGLPDPLPKSRQMQKNILGLIPQSFKELIPRRWKLKLLTATGSATDHFYSNPQQRAILQKIVSENISNDLVKIQAETLLLWGKNDPETPWHQAHKFAQLIPHSKLITFDHSGHFPFLDESQRFITTLLTEFGLE
ncbi:MAG TPA: alpha/beta hydrolase [Vitreimonas sp.]|nr:alpha/beta hydrolase [Vitreimonas sp.]